jgi:5-methylcytosine-specific restriction endonuclease McrA
MLRRGDALRCAYCDVPLAFVAFPWSVDENGRPILGRVQGSVDHVVPKSIGGSEEMRNLVLACKPCNSVKGERRLERLNEIGWHRWSVNR